MACYKLGNTASAVGNFGRAKEYLLEALKQLRDLAAEMQTPKSMDELALALMCLSAVYCNTGEIDEAWECASEAMDIWTGLVAETGIAEYRNHMEIMNELYTRLAPYYKANRDRSSGLFGKIKNAMRNKK